MTFHLFLHQLQSFLELLNLGNYVYARLHVMDHTHDFFKMSKSWVQNGRNVHPNYSIYLPNIEHLAISVVELTRSIPSVGKFVREPDANFKEK